MGEYDTVKIPTHKTPFGHLKGIKDRPGGMGKLIDHGLGGIQKIVLSAGILAPQTGKLAVQGYGPKNPVKRKLIRPDQTDPVGGQRGNTAFTGKGIAASHVVARGHLHKEVLF